MEEIMDARAWEAIVAAAPYVADGAAEAGKAAAEGAGQAVGAVGIHEAFQRLKALVRRKSVRGEEAAKAADELVADPNSDGRRTVLAEKLEASGVEGDPEIRAAAQELLDAVRSQPGGEQRVTNVMTAVGKYVAQAGPGGMANVSVNRPEGREG